MSRTASEPAPIEVTVHWQLVDDAVLLKALADVIMGPSAPGSPMPISDQQPCEGEATEHAWH